MTAPLCFVDTEAGTERVCALVGCTRTFRVAYPSTKQRFCSRSCGATSHAQHEGRANPKWRGGMTGHPLYAAYLDMVARCSRPTHHAWPRYGGRGITVSASWRANFWTFVADMGERPAGRSLDRIDNDGPYSRENCRWATHSEQQLNRRRHAHIGRPRNEKGQFA